MSKEEKPKIDPETKEAWDYLVEVIGDYQNFVENIGDLGYSAPQLLYYRDEVQEFLEMLTNNPQVNYQGAYQKVSELDQILRKKAQDVVDEIGHANFLQYQIINDPPKAHWWWWLNRVTAAPPAPPKVWEFWKYQALQGNPQQEEQPTGPPPDNPEIAAMFQREEGVPREYDLFGEVTEEEDSEP